MGSSQQKWKQSERRQMRNLYSDGSFKTLSVSEQQQYVFLNHVESETVSMKERRI